MKEFMLVVLILITASCAGLKPADLQSVANQVYNLTLENDKSLAAYHNSLSAKFCALIKKLKLKEEEYGCGTAKAELPVTIPTATPIAAPLPSPTPVK